MKQVRRGVFETNSSSSHSITITKWEPPKEMDILRNSVEVFKVAEMGQAGEYQKVTHESEIDKLRFVINMIAQAYEELTWGESEEYVKSFNNVPFEKLVNHDLFACLKEVVKEETGTEIEFIKPNGNRFPYFDMAFDDDKYTKDLLDIEIEGTTLNKEKFKTRLKEIIFNKEIIIKDCDNSY